MLLDMMASGQLRRRGRGPLCESAPRRLPGFGAAADRKAGGAPEPGEFSPAAAGKLRRQTGGSGGLQIDRAGLAPVALLDVVGEALLGLQHRHAGLLDGADMDEGVIAAGLGDDEAETAGRVEEFHFAD